MTGPLAPLFAQVREALDEPCLEVATMVHETMEARAALSSIERHVQDMGEALRKVPHILEGIGAFLPGAEVHHADGCLGCKADALLARLDQLGKEPSDG